MSKILSFSLEGRFGHFKYPYTSPNHLKKTYSIPPRTTLLGLLGGILGLKGLRDFQEGLPEYYAKLCHIPIAICMESIPKKILLRYNSLNSFANNSKDASPNIIVQEEVLLNPKYRILLRADDSEEGKSILSSIQEGQVSSVYPIYLGKNEFFAQIKGVKIFETSESVTEKKESSKNMRSIIPSQRVVFEDIEDDVGNAVLDTFSYDVSYSGKKLKTQNTEVCYFMKNVEQRGPVEFNKKLEITTIKGADYFFFNDEIIEYLRRKSC